jgi:hypothetical protein
MNNNSKNSFLLYVEQEELFNELSNEEAGKLIKAIYHYEKTGEILPLNSVTRIIMISIKQALDRNRERYQKKLEANRINGQKGGRPKKNNPNKPKKPTGLNGLNKKPNETERLNKKPKKPDSDSVPVPVPLPDRDCDNEEEEKNILKKEEIEIESNGEEKIESGEPPEKSPPKLSDDYSEEFETFWSYYPGRVGANSKEGAWKKWQVRLKEKYTYMQLINASIGYQKYCEASGDINTKFVMMAQTFLGPDKHFLTNWEEQANAARNNQNVGPGNYKYGGIYSGKHKGGDSVPVDTA